MYTNFGERAIIIDPCKKLRRIFRPVAYIIRRENIKTMSARDLCELLVMEYATISVRPEKMRFSTTPVEGFELAAMVRDYIYVGSVLKCVVSLPNGNELKIERLAGQDLPPVGSKCYPYWNVEDAVLIHNESHYIFEALNNIKLA